ncbi:hypothetical protein INR49_021215 [Caranx melampygus]|nr:hypothetical protein INR49_021215 [Caranx melampygus]
MGPDPPVQVWSGGDVGENCRVLRPEVPQMWSLKHPSSCGGGPGLAGRAMGVCLLEGNIELKHQHHPHLS